MKVCSSNWGVSCLGRCFVSVLCAFVLASITQVATARPLADVKTSGRITFFVYQDYAPYSWREADKIVGIDADLARELASQLGVKIDFLMRGADENVDDDLRINIWKGDLIHKQTADVMLHVPFDRTLQRRADDRAVLFAPYFGEQIAVVHDADALPKVETFGSFVTNPIAVELDTASDFFLSAAFRGQLQRSIRRGRTFMDAVDLFESGKTAALMASRAQSEWVKSRNPKRNFRLVQPPAPGLVRNQWPIGLAVKGDSQDLGEALQKAIGQMIRSGELAKIFQRYGVTWIPPK